MSTDKGSVISAYARAQKAEQQEMLKASKAQQAEELTSYVLTDELALQPERILPVFQVMQQQQQTGALLNMTNQERAELQARQLAEQQKILKSEGGTTTAPVANVVNIETRRPKSVPRASQADGPTAAAFA